MGLASGQVQNNQLTASTYHSVGLNPHKGRVNGTTSWSALTLTRGQYYEVIVKLYSQPLRQPSYSPYGLKIYGILLNIIYSN